MLPSQINKRVNFNFDKQKLIFDTSQELFSFAKVDDGTKELLNSLRKNSALDYKRILDLGCGYGVVGIYLKKKFPNSEVLCSDRDSLAIDFTKHNSDLNSVKIESICSLDFESISSSTSSENTKFSLIITNFPAKLERNGLEYFIAKSSEYLEKNGILALVIVKELNNYLKEIIKNKNIVISFKDEKTNYSVYHLKFGKKISTEIDPYEKVESKFLFGESVMPIRVSNALQEFDTPHYVTQLLMEKILNKKYSNLKSITVINPGQGYLPLASLHSCSREKIILASRDLLQLKISSENLILNLMNCFEKINSDFPMNKGDLLVWGLRDEGVKEILEKLETYRKNFKKIILGGRLPIIKRILKTLNLDPKIEIRGKYCAVEL